MMIMIMTNKTRRVSLMSIWDLVCMRFTLIEGGAVIFFKECILLLNKIKIGVQ